MDIEKYSILLETINAGSLSSAANNLGYTPSGISRVINSLEKDTGFPLLVRSKHGVLPTKECQLLIPHITSLIKSSENLTQIINQISDVEVGTITIGTAYNSLFPWISKLIFEYGKLHPGITFNLVEDTSSNLAHMVENGQADFCIISERTGDFNWIDLCQDELVVCVPIGHPSIEKQHFDIKDFLKETYIELYPDKETDNSRYLAFSHLMPNRKYSTSDPYAAFAMVEAGLGISLSNRMFAETIQSDTELLPLNPPRTLRVGIITANKDSVSPITKSFVKFAENYIDLL
ncbi:MAG: LysR family transcriptional regulator [Eubacterium sp.]|nr:LysR family transcriptional regulator [Eubacterium sp.]